MTERIIETSRLFRGLDPDLVRALAVQANRRAHSRGERLWRAGESAGSFTLIVSGLVKIVQQSEAGEDAILALFGPRESIGETAVLNRAAYPADAVVVSDRAEVVRVPAAQVLRAMEVDPRVARAMNQALLAHTQALREKIRIMSAGSVARRLATLLLHLHERFGDEMADGTSRIPVAVSRTELAELIGARVETTIRALSRWHKQGLLDTVSNGFVVRDPEELGRIARGEED